MKTRSIRLGSRILCSDLFYNAGVSIKRATTFQTTPDPGFSTVLYDERHEMRSKGALIL